MKKIFSYFMISMCLLGTSVVTSCGGSDDDTPDTLATLPYEADAAIYELENNSDKIAYVELTTAGNYFLEYKTMVKNNTVKMNDMEFYLPFASRSAITRGTKDNFEYGSFTKNSDGTYQLKDKNTTLKIEVDGNRYKITIGDKPPYYGTKQSKISSFADMNKLCRSWRVKKIYYKFETQIMGASTHIEEEAANYKELASKLSKYDSSTDFGNIEDIDYITFSNTGTCVVKTDNNIDRSYWRWSNGKIYLDDDTSAGLDLTFVGSTMKLDYKLSLVYEGAGSASISIGYELYETLLR